MLETGLQGTWYIGEENKKINLFTSFRCFFMPVRRKEKFLAQEEQKEGPSLYTYLSILCTSGMKMYVAGNSYTYTIQLCTS